MLSLAGLRYRNVLAVHGGPIAQLETGRFPVRGRPVFQANARLVAGLARKRSPQLIERADGTGTHPVEAIARHKAISEAIERWAFFATVHSETAAEFGFNVDPSTTGMAAFPGLLRRQARRSAVLESVERFSLFAWWEGLVDGERFETDWPGVSAVAIDGPFGGVTVVTFARTDWGGFAYGHAAEESFSAACERAVVELARHECELRAAWVGAVTGESRTVATLLDRRCAFFATEEGHERFQRRLAQRASGRLPRPEVICDRDIPGPWDAYATVWRFALRPISDEFYRGGEDYFFL